MFDAATAAHRILTIPHLSGVALIAMAFSQVVLFSFFTKKCELPRSKAIVLYSMPFVTVVIAVALMLLA